MTKPDPPTTLAQLKSRAETLRAQLERVFAPDTSVFGSPSMPPSTDHCAAVAVLVNAKFGGTYVSSVVDGRSHWFNRIQISDTKYDVDLTGDQFGYHPVMVSAYGLHANTVERSSDDIRAETYARARILETRIAARRRTRVAPTPPPQPAPRPLRRPPTTIRQPANEGAFVRQLLEAFCKVSGVRVWRQNAGKVVIREPGRKPRAFHGAPTGAGDFSGIYGTPDDPCGARIEGEVKMPDGRLRKGQRKWRKMVEARGAIYVLVTYDDARSPGQNVAHGVGALQDAIRGHLRWLSARRVVTSSVAPMSPEVIP
jgi:hypothetical protein